MLNLTEIDRQMLVSSGALTINGDGVEILRGLTVEESQFILAVEKTADQNVGAAESALYKTLRDRHIASRQMNIIQHGSDRPAPDVS